MSTPEGSEEGSSELGSSSPDMQWSSKECRKLLCLSWAGWAVVGQRMVVVGIVISSARTWQDVVDLNFL